MFKIVIGAGLIMCACAASAQDAQPLMAVAPEVAPSILLPANSEILLSMNEEVTTRGDRWNEGDTFEMSVVHDVMVDGLIIIPRGSRGIGRITWLTDKGMFGKSGKMDIELEYVEVRGRRIAVNGTYRQEGEGNTVATVGGVILAGPFAAFITGKSGVIPRGRELMAHTEQDLPVAVPAGYVPRRPEEPLTATDPNAGAQPIQASVASAMPAAASDASPALDSESRVTCETCN